MSFLLQTRRRATSSKKASGSNKNTLSYQNINKTTQASLTASKQKNNSVTLRVRHEKTTINSGGGQVLLQKQANPIQKHNHQQQASQNKNQQKHEEGVISMDEGKLKNVNEPYFFSMWFSNLMTQIFFQFVVIHILIGSDG